MDLHTYNKVHFYREKQNKTHKKMQTSKHKQPTTQPNQTTTLKLGITLQTLAVQRSCGGSDRGKNFYNTRVFEILISLLDSIWISCRMRLIESYNFISMDKRSDSRYCCCSELHTKLQWRKLSQDNVRYCSGNWLGRSYSCNNVVTFSLQKDKKHIIN